MMNLKSELKRLCTAETHYEVLGVPLAASTAELKYAHRSLARLLHPDRNPGNAEASSAMARVNVAYETLTDPKRRKKYDAQFKTQAAMCPQCTGTGQEWQQKGFSKKVQRECRLCGGSGKAPAVK